MRAREARREFEEHGLQHVVSAFHRDAYKDGFIVQDESDPSLCVDRNHPVDAVFLDLPKPYCGNHWIRILNIAIDHASEVLRTNGRISCFSPCIEQVQENCKALNEKGYQCNNPCKSWVVVIETIEVLLKEFELNSIENNNSNTTRLRNLEKKTGQVKRDQPVTEYNQSLYVPSENLLESITSMVLSKGEHIGRGHTAYLTFATKTSKIWTLRFFSYFLFFKVNKRNWLLFKIVIKG